MRYSQHNFPCVREGKERRRGASIYLRTDSRGEKGGAEKRSIRGTSPFTLFPEAMSALQRGERKKRAALRGLGEKRGGGEVFNAGGLIFTFLFVSTGKDWFLCWEGGGGKWLVCLTLKGISNGAGGGEKKEKEPN